MADDNYSDMPPGGCIVLVCLLAVMMVLSMCGAAIATGGLR